LRLDVSMTDALRMDVGEGTEKLIDVELDFKVWHESLELVEVTGSTVDCLGNVFEDQIEVDFVFLLRPVRTTDGAIKKARLARQLTRSPLL
jgi:hypothetical protein